MPSKLPHDIQLRSIIDAMNDSLLNASEEEIRDEAAAMGVDLTRNAQRLKQMFNDTAKAFKKRKFVEAQQEYERQTTRYQSSSFETPKTAADKRALLQLVAAQYAQTGGGLTAKFRDLESISDNDLDSLLQELAALGFPLKFEKK